jgi:hypothetical protein
LTPIPCPQGKVLFPIGYPDQEKTGLTVACEVPLPVKYETVEIDAGF